jgi:tetratricopeptide (TPR) repeat protein
MNEEAIAHLRKALKLEPSLADAHRLLSFIYGEAGGAEQATEHAARAAELNPAAAKAQANLSLDRYSSAQYVELTGSQPSPTTEAKDAFVHYTLGIAFRARGLYEEARQEFSRGRDAGEDLTLIGQAEAELALLEGDAEGALARYDELIGSMGDSAKVWNERGVTLHQVGRLEEAEESYKRALSIDDHYALAWNNVGVLSAHRNDSVSAESAFRRALELLPEMDDAQLNLGLLWIKEEMLDESLEVHEAMLKRDANRADAWNGLGSTLMAMDRTPEARNAFAHAVELNPKFTPARYNLSFALARLGDHDGALRETKSALELDPYYTAPRYKLSIDLQYEGSDVWAPDLAAPERVAPRDDAVRDFDFDPAELEEVFKGLDVPAQAEQPLAASEVTVDDELAGEVEAEAEADIQTVVEAETEVEAEVETEAEVEAEPEVEALATEPEVEAVSLDAARDYVYNGLYDNALAEATRAVREGADRAEGALVIGEVYRLRGLYGEALERFEEARMLRPGEPEALAGVALCLLHLDRLEEAREAAEDLQPKAGDDLSRLITVGEVLTRSGDAKRAMEVLDVAVQIAPNDPVVHRQLARAALAGGNRRRAKNAYWKAITEDPDYAAARVELGEILIDEGAYAEAEGEIRRALALMPTYTEASLVLASLLGRQGKTRETINLVAEVLESEPYNLEALVMLGEALAKEGRHRDAEQAFWRVLHFDPDRPVALFRLGELSAESGRYKEALKHWRRLFEVDPDSEYAARARVQARVALGLGGGFEGAVAEGGG